MNKFDEVLKIRREEIRQKRSRALEMQRKRMKKEQRKEIFVFILLTIGLITTIVLSMKLGQDAMKNCIKAGHSVQYCERGL